MLGLLALNLAGLRAGARTQNVLSIAKLALILIITAGALAAAPAVVPATPRPLSPAALVTAVVPVFYAYGGYANTMNLGGDVRDPQRNLPRAIVAGMLIVTAVYVLANWAYLRVLGVDGVAASGLVAAAMGRAAFGPWGEVAVSVAIYVSAAGFLNATILQMPRSYYAMAEDGVLPASFLRVDARGTLRAGLALFAATMLIPALALGSFEKLLSYVMFTDTLSLAVVASTLFVLRRDAPTDGFRVPAYPLLPILYIAVVLALGAFLFYKETTLALAGLAVFALGAVLFTAARRPDRT
jgi:APA family basic amino acid/polyamine antiporter